MNASSGKLLQTVIVPIAALVALAMGVVVTFIWFSATTQDRIALEKSIEAVQTAIERRHAAIAANVTDYAWWNDAVQHLDLSLDEAWADVNVGAYQYETYEIELSLVVDRNNQTIFERLDGEPSEVGAFQLLPGGLDGLIRQARAAPTKSAMGVLPFRDGLAFVAASAVTPYSPEEIQIPEGRIVLIFAKAITQELLDALAEPLPLSDLRVMGPGESAIVATTLPLVSPNGDLLGRLVWQPHQPGREFLRAVTPALAIAIILIAAFTYAVLRHARETTKAVEASEVRFRDVADAASDWIWEVDASSPHLHLRTLRAGNGSAARGQPRPADRRSVPSR
jgi:sensor domain CHASE-containing protein